MMLDGVQNLEFTPFLLSFKLAGITTLILFVVSVPLAWYLSQTKSKSKPLLEALTALPIVLPPSVLGFYLLVILSQNSPLGIFFDEYFGLKLVFNFTGLVVASCFYSLPFMVQPLQGGFESLDKNMLEASYIAGKSKPQTIFKVALPNIKPAVLTAIIITFAHTVGEFGVVLFAQNSVNITSTNSNQLQVKTTPAKSKNKPKHRYDPYYDKKIEEYEARMQANARKYKKMARKLKKPQYSDPSYFGHKNKPKKRAPGKRKFCKECEIVH